MSTITIHLELSNYIALLEPLDAPKNDGGDLCDFPIIMQKK